MKTSAQQQEQEITDILSHYFLEDIKKHSLPGKPIQKLSVYLSKVRKPALTKRAMQLGISNSEDMKKPELVQMLMAYYQEPKVIKEIVTWSTSEEKIILKELMTGSYISVSKDELTAVYIDIKFLIDTGIVNVFEDEGEFVLVLQDEIKQILLALNWKKLDTDSAQAFEITKYCAAAISLYGALPIAKVYEIYAEYGEGEALITKTKFNKLVFGSLIRSQSYWTDRQHLYSDYFTPDDLDDLSDMDELMDSEEMKGLILNDILKNDMPYYRPDLATFLKYAEPNYEPENLKLDSLMTFLRKFASMKAEIWDDLRDEILYSVEFGRIQDTVEALEEFGVRFNTRQDLDKFMKLYTEVVNNTRIWVNHGYTPVELRKLTTSSAMVSGNGYANFSANTSALPTKKVGRNELCPCGSGKKYKRCCGAN